MITSIGLVDDDDLILRCLPVTLQPTGINTLWACHAQEALERHDFEWPDVIVVDVRMPILDGFEFAQLANERFAAVTVVLLSSVVDDSVFVKAMEVGAAGYLLKSDAPEALGVALHAAGRGLRAFSGGVPPGSRQIENALAGEMSRSPLTPRETQVLQLLSESLTNQQMSHRLGISFETVKHHVSSILIKLGVPDRLGAVVWGIRHGVVSVGCDKAPWPSR